MFSSQNINPPQGAPTFAVTALSILEDATRLIESAREAQDHVAHTASLNSVTIENVLLPLALAENCLLSGSKLLQFHRFVSVDSAIREASAQAESMFKQFAAETAMREDIFKLVDALNNNPTRKLDAESKHFLDGIRGEFIKGGLNIPAGPQRDHFVKIQARINKLTNEFEKNAAAATTACAWFSTEELEGVPQDTLSALEKGEGQHEGKVRVVFRDHLRTVMRFASNPNTRKRAYIAHSNRCNENVPLFHEVVVLRDEAARLLGYPSHAALVVESKMARNTKTVHSMLNTLRSGLMQAGLGELERYKAIKEADYRSRDETWDEHYYLWDQPFYSRKLLLTAHSVNHDEISEYFPLQTTISGMMDIFGRLFGITFVEMTVMDSIIWHEDVQVFSAWNPHDHGGEFLGYLYLDLFSRAFKHTNPGNFPIVPGCIRADGSRVYPSSALICSFPKPTSDNPCLLRHDDVVTLFHELGHGIHDLVSKTKYARFHGSGGTVVDFGEAPSQMLENWCWDPSQLRFLSKHYSYLSQDYLKLWESKAATKSDSKSQERPRDRLSYDSIQNLLKSRNANQALSTLNQVQISIFDLKIHDAESQEVIKKMNISATYNRLKREIFPLDSPHVLGEGDEWGHGYSDWRMLMSGDYHAGYYAYLLANVYSADMFDSVFKIDLMNMDEGRRYRREVLEKGGGQPEMETLVGFLGRDPSPHAFYKELGLVS